MSRLEYHLLARAALAIFVSSLVLALGYADLAEGADHAKPDREDTLQAFNRDVYWLDGATLRNPTADTSPYSQFYSAVGMAIGVTWGQ
jgi:hypothetical protein